MQFVRTIVTRATVVAAIALAASLVERAGTVARAEETKKVVVKPPPESPTRSPIPSECAKQAYDALAKEVPALRVAHAADDAAFAAAYAARKKALVSSEALAARGCAPSRYAP